MKSINDTNNNNGSNSNNWLGFSLSTSDPTHPQAPTSFYLSPNAAFRYGYGENGNFHSPLSVMPLKSDGSLCIMEALTRSHPQGMVTSHSPKLEDFLGGQTMEAHEYGVSHDRESMSLSLDSLYFNSNSDQETSFRQHQQEIEVQNNTYYSSLSCNGMYQTTLSEEAKNTHLGNPTMGGGSWMSSHYSGTVEAGGVSGGGGGGGELQSLSLSMSPGSQSSCVTVPRQISPSGGNEVVAVVETKKRERGSGGKLAQKQPVHRKSIDTFGQRTSQYRGVTRHRWTGRYEAHLWDNSCKKEGQTRKGRQVYLGGYDMEEKAARAYDQAALKYWGPSTHINFPLENYQEQLEQMKNMTRQEYVAHLRRKSSGFSRGASMYRGVTRHHQHGRWQARIGRVAGNKDLYLGTFSTQEEAAEAYDIAAIKFRGATAVTNFDISRYDVEKIMASNTLLAGELARRNKEKEPQKTLALEYHQETPVQHNGQLCIQNESNNGQDMADWKMALYQPPQEEQQNGCLDENSYRNNNYSVALQDLIGIDSVLPSQAIMDESCKLQGAHYSNPSSLVTSLGSSREASPDKNGSMLFPKPPVVTSSWMPSAELRGVAVPMGHFPVFAAWNDS